MKHIFGNTFTPKFFRILHTFTPAQIRKDILSGLIVGIIALPLAIAFGIASGVTPERGLITAVVAGFLISFLGGSRVQIGGPTGAFIVIVYGIVHQHGVDALIVATFLAGIMLMLMGFARLGNIIKFIPYPLIVGFTSGIALIIFSSQIKDLLGLKMGSIPADFSGKWIEYFRNIHSLNLYAVGISLATLLISLSWQRITRKVPGTLIAILVTTAAVTFFKLPVETIGSKFGSITGAFPTPEVPDIDWSTFKQLISPAFAIALLAGIESLLSAVVSDGMIGKNHNSNMELVAQGAANIASSVFGGIPATGAIARTAANVKNGGRTPVAGMTHAVVLLLIMLFIGKWASLIPMATLAGILLIIAYNMSEWQNFISVARGPKSDMLVLIITFVLTVLIDLTVAIEIGMILAVFLFMRDMTRQSNVENVTQSMDEDTEDDDPLAVSRFEIPKSIEVYEIKGPLFFGAAYKFRDAIRQIEKKPKILILRMRSVPYIDATGIRVLKEVYREMQHKGVWLVLSGITNPQVLEELKKSRLLFMIGKANVKTVFPEALERAKYILFNQQMRNTTPEVEG
jgi:SulP family sulfate permease